MSGDRSQAVRYQLALTLGSFRQGNHNPILEGILRPDVGNSLVEGAVLSSLQPSAAATFGSLARDARFRRSPAGNSFLSTLVSMLGVRGDLEEALQTLDVLNALQVPPEQAMTWLYEFGAGLQRTRSSLALIDAQGDTRMLYRNLTIAGLDGANPVPQRAAAIKAVGVSPLTFAQVGDWLLLVLNPAESVIIQSAALDALQRVRELMVGPGIAERWSTMSPAVRSQAGSILISRHEWIGSLLEAVQAGRINPGELSPATVNFLRTHGNPDVNQRAVQLFGTGPIQRPQVITAFRPAIDLNGSGPRGRDIFAARCAMCHSPLQPDSLGGNPASFVAKGKERLLQDIIEPHRQITPGKRTTVIETRSGENLIGVVQQESLLAISLRQADNTRVIVPRGNVAVLLPQVWSLMPEGLEMGLTPQAMADLLAYLETLAPPQNR